MTRTRERNRIRKKNYRLKQRMEKMKKKREEFFKSYPWIANPKVEMDIGEPHYQKEVTTPEEVDAISDGEEDGEQRNVLILCSKEKVSTDVRHRIYTACFTRGFFFKLLD